MIKAVIEMPHGTYYKYETNKDTGRLVIDRVLNQDVPENYGFIPGTLAEDGDPLDVFVIAFEPIESSAQCNAAVIGMYECLDNGVKDNKIVSVLHGENFSTEDYDGIYEYLETYKLGFEVLGFRNISESLTEIETCRKRFEENK